MAHDRQQILETVRKFVLSEFLPDEDPTMLTESTPLMKGAILDSIATVKLVAFLEKQYGIEFKPYEMSVDYLDTLADISRTVGEKLSRKTTP
jgi:acyl carrier protein